MKKVSFSKRWASFKIMRQGVPRVLNSWITATGPKVIAMGLELEARGCVIFTTGGSENGQPVLILGDSADETKLTEIEFIALKGWVIWSANVAKHTLCLCFTRGHDLLTVYVPKKKKGTP